MTITIQDVPVYELFSSRTTAIWKALVIKINSKQVVSICPCAVSAHRGTSAPSTCKANLHPCPCSPTWVQCTNSSHTCHPLRRVSKKQLTREILVTHTQLKHYLTASYLVDVNYIYADVSFSKQKQQREVLLIIHFHFKFSF